MYFVFMFEQILMAKHPGCLLENIALEPSSVSVTLSVSSFILWGIVHPVNQMTYKLAYIKLCVCLVLYALKRVFVRSSLAHLEKPRSSVGQQ